MDALTGSAPFSPIELGLEHPGSDARRHGARNRALPRAERNVSRENTDATGLDLSPEKQEQIQKMKARDREVRTHEQAHIAASGGVSVAGPNYELRKGPDGRMYAVGGSVQIDTSEGSTPEETVSKAQQIRRAATAPAQPSGQDRAVAAQASQMESEARKEVGTQRSDDQNGRLSAQVRPLSPEYPGRRAQSGQSAPAASVQAVTPAQSTDAFMAYSHQSLFSQTRAEYSEDGSPRSGYLNRSGLRSPRDPQGQPSPQTLRRASQAYGQAYGQAASASERGSESLGLQRAV